MNFDEYQKQARKTAIYPNIGNNHIYPALGLASETGELLGKIKKLMRGDYDKFLMGNKYSEEFIQMIEGELGDVMWYISNLCDEFGLSLDDIAIENLMKLQKRQKENKLRGDGDNR